MKDAKRSRRANQGSFIVDGRDTVLGFDQAMETLTGWPAIEVVGQGRELRIVSNNLDSWSAARTVPLYEGDLSAGTAPSQREMTLHCRDGRKLDVEVSARPLQGPGSRMLVTVLQILASSPGRPVTGSTQGLDLLTGLGDHETFASQLAQEFALANSTASPLSVILLDVDRLREVNDRSGRLAGDEVLRKIAGILRVSVDGEARIARLAGDDFAILLAGGGRGEARQLAASLRSTIERFRFFPTHDATRRITVSLGTASYPADADNETELVARATEALDEARSMGRNRVWCYLRRPRVPLQVPVYFDGVDPLLVGYARDLSPSGIFVQTTEGIDVGMRCALAFPLPGHDGKVHVVGRVVRTVLPDTSADAELRIPGLGVEFERFGGASDRRAIETFLHGNETKTTRPERGILSV